MPDQTDSQPSVKLDYQTPQAPSTNRALRAIILSGLALALLLLIASVFFPSLNSRGSSPRAKCASNMHQIGLAILLYQGDHEQRYPNSLDELMEEQLTSNVFICPESKDVASTGATTQEIIDDFHQPGHQSYIYLGAGLTDKTVTDDTVVLYEPLSNHGGFGMHVLFGDGHAEWLPAATAAKLIAAISLGHRPVRYHDVFPPVSATSKP